MRRDDLKQTLTKINSDINETKIDRAVHRAGTLRASKTKDTRIDINSFLSSYADYCNRVSFYSNDEKKILEILGLDSLTNSELWSIVLSADQDEENLRKSRIDFRRSLDAIIIAQKAVPRIINLIAHKDRNVFDLKRKDRPESFKDNELLNVLLIEDHNEYSSPERISKLMASITELYCAVAPFYEFEKNTLSVLSIDSGSDKSFDFLGVAAGIKELRN